MATRASYPHPVLDTSDDVASTFEVFNFTVAPTVDDIELQFRVRLDDTDLQEMIADGRARLSFRWHCTATLATGELEPRPDRVHADGQGYLAWIDQQDVRGKVDLTLRIVAGRELPHYRLSRQHPDYQDATFHVRAGDLLADAGKISFVAEKLYDPMRPPLAACFRFERDAKPGKRLKVSFLEDDAVVVRLPEDMHDGFAALADRVDLQVSLVVLPALMEAIAYVQRNESATDVEDHAGRIWYGAVKSLIEENGGLEAHAFEVAQRILGNPLATSLTTSLNTTEDE